MVFYETIEGNGFLFIYSLFYIRVYVCEISSKHVESRF